MLATTISAQIQSKGELPQSIEDFGNGKYGTFKKPEKANDEQFTMQITGMDSAVCEQMEKMSGGMVRKAECSGTTLTLTYNNNLSTDKVAADYNGDTNGENCTGAGYKWCSELSTPACKKDCCSGITLNSCQESCDLTTGEITNKEDETDCTTADGKKGTCNAGECEEKVDCPNGLDANEEGKCICTDHTTNQCGLGYYCQFDPSDCFKESCCESSRGDGVCTAVGSGKSIKDGAYLKSPSSMDWWNAYSWCKGNGMEPLTGTIAGKSLSSSHQNWIGNGPIYQYLGEGMTFWTGHDKGDFCEAWAVTAHSSSERVHSSTRGYKYYALCQ
jgi:hypothetical protein